MKTFIKSKYALILLAVTLLISCETDFENPNSATDEQVFSSREGIFAATVGMRQLYSTNGLRFIIETPAITTREGGITTTFQNMIELEDGGANLPNFNSNVQGLWFNLLRVMKLSEDIINATPTIELEDGTASGLIAYAKLFKAICIGGLSQHYENVIIQTSNDNQAQFVSRIEGYQEAIRLLNEALSEIQNNLISDEFIDEILKGEIDLENSILAMLARFNLFAGNYDAAITSANNVDLTSTSVFTYDDQNFNPIWNRVIQGGAPNFKPRDNFGLPDSFVFEGTDGRLSFYLEPDDATNQNQLPIEELKGFFDAIDKSIPLYIPDEMNLIIAEANLRKTNPDITAAVSAINEVRTDTNDPLGINANIPEYMGPLTVSELLLEVYQNRRAELFLTGMSLEDSRRFNRPQPSPASQVFSDERNRNFYPYPDTERNNNPNTPDDPAI
ncbi:RagB/SusD family nutrient uptake outer membrane protein [Aquimarina celericrescens]|uniref:RagB/SusD family nutrient uptake outer membrane protein n=1 Tax=Aquimarina celericrescens TaxID=1964542 RepID=A0ABW5AWK6_9FLAO|nr:RagB/SusD family nutrient uptake outer membrane protein [Aquimarina celericrescens]